MVDIPNRFKKLRTDKSASVCRLSKISNVSENYIHNAVVIFIHYKSDTLFVILKLSSNFAYLSKPVKYKLYPLHYRQ